MTLGRPRVPDVMSTDLSDERCFPKLWVELRKWCERLREPQEDQPNHVALTGISASTGAAGRVKWKVAPCPPSGLAQIRPPCDSTMDLLIARPMPLPCGLVVKNASRICSALPGGSPGPVSLTETSI